MKPRLESCTASLLLPRGPFLPTAVTSRRGSHISCWVSLSLISVRCLSFEFSQHLKPSSVRQCCHWNMPALYFKLFECTDYLFHLCTPVSGTCGECSVNGPDAVWVLKPLTSETFLLSEKTTSPHPYDYEVLVYLRIYQLEIIFFFLIYYLFIIFIFGCVGSSSLCEGPPQPRRAGATPHRGARASHYRGPSCCGAEAPDAQAQQLWLTGPAAPRHAGSSQTRARTRAPRIGRQTPNHCATREALEIILCKRHSVLIPDCSSLARWPWAELWNNFCRLWLESFKWRIWHRLSPCSNEAAKFCGLETKLSCWKTSGQWALLPGCLYVCAAPWRFIRVACTARQTLK